MSGDAALAAALNASRSKNKDLHGSAPDECAVALLVIDWINDFDFEGGEKLFLPAAA